MGGPDGGGGRYTEAMHHVINPGAPPVRGGRGVSPTGGQPPTGPVDSGLDQLALRQPITCFPMPSITWASCVCFFRG